MSDVNESDPRSNVHALFSLLPKKCTLLQGSLSFTSLSTVQIYDFHIFLTVYVRCLRRWKLWVWLLSPAGKKTYVVQFKQASRKAFCKHCFMLFGATILGLSLSWSHDLPNKVVTWQFWKPWQYKKLMFPRYEGCELSTATIC